MKFDIGVIAMITSLSVLISSTISQLYYKFPEDIDSLLLIQIANSAWIFYALRVN